MIPISLLTSNVPSNADDKQDEDEDMDMEAVSNSISTGQG